MKKIILLISILICSFFIINPQDLTTDLKVTLYLPRVLKTGIFEKEILNNITDQNDKDFILKYYHEDPVKLHYFLKAGQKKAELLELYNTIYKYENTHGILELEKQIYIHENDNPVFLQKSGMLGSMEHSFYFRTDDEWTGFSTIFLGYRFGLTNYFNIGLEGGVGLPQVYIASILLHFKIFESPDKTFFAGLRGRIGYKYQNAEKFLYSYDSKTGESKGYLGFGKDYLTIENRHSLYFASDLTLAVRFGRLKSNAVYYTFYPKVDFDLSGGQTYVLLCPIMIGYEVRWGYKNEWSFAVESGYSFPVPWGSVPDGKWINFPSIANVSLNYRFGDKFYSKLNQEKIYNNALK